MKMKWMLHGLLATSLAIPAFGQIGIYIGRTPPPFRWEPRPPLPGEGFIWIDGYWTPQYGRWVWVPGRWERPPYPGAYWSHPHYDHYSEGWRYHEGHWDREDHDDHHDWGHHDHDRDHDRHH